jgi:hypothetical protein
MSSFVLVVCRLGRRITLGQASQDSWAIAWSRFAVPGRTVAREPIVAPTAAPRLAKPAEELRLCDVRSPLRRRLPRTLRVSRRQRRQWSRSWRAGAILTTTLAADVWEDIAGYALCANRQDHIGRSTLARNGIHRRSGSSGCTLLRAKANHREPRQQPRLSDEAPNVLFPVAANGDRQR